MQTSRTSWSHTILGGGNFDCNLSGPIRLGFYMLSCALITPLSITWCSKRPCDYALRYAYLIPVPTVSMFVWLRILPSTKTFKRFLPPYYKRTLQDVLLLSAWRVRKWTKNRVDDQTTSYLEKRILWKSTSNKGSMRSLIIVSKRIHI